MNRLALLLITLLLFTFMSVQAEAAAPILPTAKTKVIVLPIINSSQLSDDWVVQHIQETLSKRFSSDKYEYTDPTDVSSFLRDTGFAAGFGALPDKTTTTGLTNHFAADGFLGLEITRIAYTTKRMSLTDPTGNEQVVVIITANIYDAKTNNFRSYNSRKTFTKELGPFTPYEKDETVTAGLDLCIQDILPKVDF